MAEEEITSIVPSTVPSPAPVHSSYYDITQNIDALTNTTSLVPASDVNVDGVIASILLNLCAFVVMIILYEILLRTVPTIYAGRRMHVRISRMVSELPSTCIPLAWVRSVLTVPWARIREVSGLDAYFFLRYIRVCKRIMAVSALWGVLILWPTFYTGGGDMPGFYRLSMANVLQSHWRLWVPTVFIWLQTLYVIYLLDEELKHYVEIRMDFLGKGDKDVDPQQRYSVIVENIPIELRSDQALFNYFNKLIPGGKVHSASVVMNIGELERLVTRRLRVVRRLEKAQAFNRATGKWATHIVGEPRISCLRIECLPFSSLGHPNNMTKIQRYEKGDEVFEKGERVDSIEYYTRDLARMNEKVAQLQQEMVDVASRGDDNIYATDWFGRIVQHAFAGRLDDDGISSESREKYGSFDATPENGTKIEADPDIQTELPEISQRKSLPRARFSLDNPCFSPNMSSKRLVDDDFLDEGIEDKPSNLVQPGGRDKHKSIIWRFFGKIGLDFVSAGFTYVNHQLDVVVDSVIGRSMSSTGFVSFTDLPSVCYAASAPLCHQPGMLQTSLSPEPRDIIWKNIQGNIKLVKQREDAANFLLSLGAILWSIPLIAIQSLATAESLSRVPFMSWLSTSSNVNLTAFINGYLPVVALLTLIMILPIIFEWVAINYENRKTYSDVQNSILNRYFYYQLANIFITVTAGSIWDSLNDLLYSPYSAFVILGRSLPTVVGYFISFLATKTLAGLPMVLLRAGALSKMLFYRLCLRESKLTQRELDEAIYRKEEILYGWEYPTQLLVVVICFTYACISPVILIFGAVYFQGALVVYQNQLLHVYTAKYESGGLMFTSVIDRTLVGLICGQVTFLGYIIIRQGYYQPIFLFPLPFFTWSIMRRFKSMYVQPSTQLSLQRAQEIELENKELGPFNLSKLREGAFRQPALIVEPERPLPYRRDEQNIQGQLV